MNMAVDPHVSLTEPEVEAIVLGSLISNPEALAALASDLNPEWFADPAARMFVDAALGIHASGNRVTAALLAATVSPAIEFGDMTRGAFIAGLMTKALPTVFLSGHCQILRNRWARRVMVQEAENLQREAVSALSDPFEASGAGIAALDAIGASFSESDAGTLGAGIDQMFEDFRNPKSTRMVTTGMRSLDVALNGYAPGKLYVIAGRPGMGKSAIACSSLWRTAKAGYGVEFFSLEMGREEINARCLSDAIDNVNGPHFGTILKGAFTVADGDLMAEAHRLLAGLPFHVDASPGLTFSQIAARARKRKSQYEAAGRRLDVVCIDHMGLVKPSDRYRGNKVAEAGEVSGAAKALAKELGCCVVLLCQLSRNVEGREDKRPTLADLRWSGEIEQDADVVAFVYRESYYLAQKPNAEPAELQRARFGLEFLVRKNRNGETRDIPLWCSIAHSSMRDAT
jgi:replicative DNA helicase